MPVRNGLAIPVMGVYQVEGFCLVGSLQDKTVNGLELLKHLHNGKASFYGHQAFLSLEFHCRDDVSGL